MVPALAVASPRNSTTKQARFKMTPTPASHSTFQNFRFRRRPNTIPFQREATPVASAATPVTPLVDQDDDQEMESHENEDGEDGEEEDEDSDIEEEGAEGDDVEEEEEEGGIEEGSCGFSPSYSPTSYRALQASSQNASISQPSSRFQFQCRGATGWPGWRSNARRPARYSSSTSPTDNSVARRDK